MVYWNGPSFHSTFRPAQKCRTKIKKKNLTPFFLPCLLCIMHICCTLLYNEGSMGGPPLTRRRLLLCLYYYVTRRWTNSLPAMASTLPRASFFTFSFYLPIEHHTFSKSIIIVHCTLYTALHSTEQNLSIFWVNFITLRLYVYNFEQNKQTSTRFYIVCEREDGIALKWFLHRLLQHETSGEKRQPQCLTCYKLGERKRGERERKDHHRRE